MIGERRSWLTERSTAVFATSSRSRLPLRRAAEPLTLTAVDEEDRERDPVLRVASCSVCVGGRKNQLNASMLTIDDEHRVRSPHSAATGSTAKR